MLKYNPPPVLLLLFVLTSCEQGLAPESPPQQGTSDHGIAGTIYFQNWPPPDSVKNLAIVAFREYPQGDLLSEVLRQNPPFILISPPDIPYGASDTAYILVFDSSPPGMYEYIAIGQRFGPELFNSNHWRVAGVYYSPGDTTQPGSVLVSENIIVQGIDIYVDFNNPPPPP
jgi:hypothetical protein